MSLANIHEQLDRAYANRPWRTLFPEARVNHMPTIASDHRPLFVHFDGTPTPHPIF